jgi:hypothetical protein
MAIDNNFESSDFSQEASFTISYPWRFVNQGGLIDRRIQPVDNPTFAWADFNNDGLSDFIYLGSQFIFSSGPTGIYQNMRNRFEKVTSTGLEGLTGLKNIEVKCVDINADGLIDIVIAGEDPNNFGSTPTFRVYQNQNQNNNFRFIDVTSKFSIPQTLRTPKLEFSDFDNDILEKFYAMSLRSESIFVKKEVIHNLQKDKKLMIYKFKQIEILDDEPIKELDRDVAEQYFIQNRCNY